MTTTERPATAAGRATRNSGGRRRRKAPKTGARRWLKPVALTLGGTLVAGCGAGYLYLKHLDSNIQHAPLGAGNAPPPPGPTDAAGHTAMNILIIGTDSRAGLNGAYGDRENTGIGNNDVNIVLHVYPDRKSAVALSLPRDTLIDLPQCKDPKTGQVYRAQAHRPLNEALGRGGPGCVSDTVQSITQLRIDHFALVNFQGVKDLTDAVNGVDVNLCSPIHDPESHLDLSAGQHTLNGEQGLAFVRTRKAVQDGSSLGRFTMQRAFLSALLKKVTSAGTLLDPTTAFPVVEAATKSITVDDPISGTTKLVGLATELKDIKPAGVAFVQPAMHYTPNDPNPDFRAKAAFTQPEANQLFSLILNDKSLTGGPDQGADPAAPATSAAPAAPSAPATSAAPAAPSAAATAQAPAASVDPASVTVTVQNGAGQPHLAGSTVKTLTDLHFGATAGSDVAKTATSTVRYARAAEKDGALAVAKALGLPDSAVAAGGSGSGVLVTLGTDFHPAGGGTGATTPAAPVPTAVPTDITVHTGDDSNCIKGWTGSLDQ